jgi:hypothetical protein
LNLRAGRLYSEIGVSKWSLIWLKSQDELIMMQDWIDMNADVGYNSTWTRWRVSVQRFTESLQAADADDLLLRLIDEEIHTPPGFYGTRRMVVTAVTLLAVNRSVCNA